MYHVRLRGTHYEAGLRFGDRLRKHGVILNTCPTFPIDEARIEYGKACREEISIYYPEIIQEVKGLADGNGADFDFLCALIFTMYAYDCGTRCSCFAYRDGDKTVFGRNSDFPVSLEKLYMNVLYQLEGVYSFTGNTTAFIEMEDGVNEYGFAVGLTFIPVKKIKPGFNAGILTRYLLEKCKTVNEAVAEIQKLPIASGGTLTMADSTGAIMVAELSADDINIICPQKNYVFATNVFVSEKMTQLNIPGFDNWQAETRYQVMENAFERMKPSLSFARDLLGGKFGFMCQYDRKKNADTVWSVIYDLSEKRIYRAEGNPGRKAYKEDLRFKFAQG